MIHADDHSWATKRLLAHLAGLLDHEETSRLTSHLEDCQHCRETLEALVDRPATGETLEGHVPAAIIAAWETSRKRLKGLERSLIRRHLEECAACRQDLELLGQTPFLERVPDLELSEDISPPAHPVAETEETSVPQVRVILANSEGSLRDRFRWLLGAWAVAATAAALVLLALPQGADDRDHGAGVLPLVHPKIVRGGLGVERLELRSGTSAAIVVLSVPPVLPRDQEATIDILSPTGERVLRRLAKPHDLKQLNLFVHWPLDPSIEDGRYTARIWSGAGEQPEADATEIPFEVEILDR